MSSELKLKLVFDASDAARAADALPDAMDRASRKGRKSYEGRGQHEGTKGDYERMAGMDPAIRKKMEADAAARQKEADKASKAASAAADAAEKAKNDEYTGSLKWNSKIQEDADKAAAAEEDAKNKEYKDKLKWNSKIQQDADKAAAAQTKSAETESEKELKRKNSEYVRNLKFNSKIQEGQDKLTSKAGDWEENFIGKITKGLTVTKLAAGAFFGFMAMGFKLWSKSFELGNKAGQSSSAYGTDPTDIFRAQTLAKVISGMDEKAVEATGQRAASMSQDIATGVSGEGAGAFQYFGFDRAKHIKSMEEGFSFMELLANMADKYEVEGKSQRFQGFAKEILGSDWKQYKNILAAGRGVIESPTMTLDAKPRITPFSQGTNQANLQRLLVGEGRIKDPHGGGNFNYGMPSNMPVTSIQSMGGGDILSAINKGPMDIVAKATQETAENTKQIAQDSGRSRRDPNGVISIIK